MYSGQWEPAFVQSFSLNGSLPQWYHLPAQHSKLYELKYSRAVLAVVVGINMKILTIFRESFCKFRWLNIESTARNPSHWEEAKPKLNRKHFPADIELDQISPSPQSIPSPGQWCWAWATAAWPPSPSPTRRSLASLTSSTVCLQGFWLEILWRNLICITILYKSLKCITI